MLGQTKQLAYMLMWVGFKEVFNTFIMLQTFSFGYCLSWGLNKKPGINLQMSISAKVTKIAAYSLIDLTFANFALF